VVLMGAATREEAWRMRIYRAPFSGEGGCPAVRSSKFRLSNPVSSVLRVIASRIPRWSDHCMKTFLTALAVILIVAAAAASQITSSVAAASTPVYVNGIRSSIAGTDVKVVATFHHILDCSGPISGLGKCGVHVHLLIANNQATDLDFDPADTSMDMDGVRVVQMDEKQVHNLGNSMIRHHRGNTGNAEFQDTTTIRQTMLRRNTVQSGGSVAGELYFEIPKDQRKNFNPATAHLTVMVQGTSYQLQF
jgi:hypothetical protein